MKKFIYEHTRLHRGMMTLFASLLALVICVYTICGAWRGTVDDAFGIVSGAVTLSDDENDYTYQSRFKSAAESIAAEKELGIRLQQEGSVLLKGTAEDLQVEGSGITLFGMRSYMTQYGSSVGSTVSKKADERTSFEAAFTDRGYKVNPALVSFYKEKVSTYAPVQADPGNCTSVETGTVIHEVPVSEYTADKTGDYSGYQDAAIIVLGRDAGESCSFYPGESGVADPAEFTNSPTGNILSLSNDERDLIQYVKNQGFQKIIVMLNSVATMEIEELKTDAAIDSILWIGTPGCYGSLGIADLVKGTVLPSGHLADTYAVNTAKSAAVQNYGVYTFANAGDIDPSSVGDAATNSLRSSWYVAETEGIYVGYKYYETRYYDSLMDQGNAALASHNETYNGGEYWNYDDEVTYSFGYGVEGSSFSETVVDTQIDWTGEKESTVTVEVKNTGNQAAKHVVQLYVQVPYTEANRVNGVEKSAIQLIGYGKTGEEDNTYLEPGKTENVTITFKADSFASYDDTFAHDEVVGAYRLDAGDYYFATGNGAHDALQTIIKEQNNGLLADTSTTGVLVGKINLAEDVIITETKQGGRIENHFDSADLNNLNCGTEVTYLSRNDWAGTFPTEVTEVTATSEMITNLQNQTADLEAANEGAKDTEFIFGEDNGAKAYQLRGITDYNDPLFEQVVNGTSLDNILNSLMGNVLTDENTVTPRPYPSDSPLGYIVPYGKYNTGVYALEEGDEGYGYEPNVFCSGTVVATSFNHKLAEEQGLQVADDGFWTGVDWWFGPGLNLHRTPYNGRNIEYYSEDSVLSGTMARDVINAYQSMGMIAGVKHFAFNDQEANRDGIAVFFDEQGGRENELRSFEYALVDANSKSVMTGFNRIGCTFTSANTDFITGLVRDEWKYNGFVLTDSTKSGQYMRANECLLAGTDMMLGGFTHYGPGKDWEDIDADKLKDNPALVASVRESYHRYLYTLANAATFNGLTESSKVGATPIWEIVLISLEVVLGVLVLVTGAFWGISLRSKGKVKKEEINHQRKGED